MNTGNRTGLKMTNYAKGEREIVLDILMEREKKGTYSNVLVRKALDRYAGIPQTQRSFIKRLAEGTIERQIELDGIIKSHLRNKDDPIRPIVLCLLRMSVYQIYAASAEIKKRTVTSRITSLRWSSSVFAIRCRR